MFPFEIEGDREGEMKGNGQNWREEVSIFGSCGLPYLAFFAGISEAQRAHTHTHTP